MKTYMYCTLEKPYLINRKMPYDDYLLINQKGFNELNGTVCVECDVEEIDEFTVTDDGFSVDGTNNLLFIDMKKETQLTLEELQKYVGIAKNGYAYHLKNVKPCDLRLSDFISVKAYEKYIKNKCPYLNIDNVGFNDDCFIATCEKVNDLEVDDDTKTFMQCEVDNGNCEKICPLIQIKKAPQSYQYAYYKGERVLLMSVRAKWVENIINGEKTVEVRKKRASEIK